MGAHGEEGEETETYTAAHDEINVVLFEGHVSFWAKKNEELRMVRRRTCEISVTG